MISFLVAMFAVIFLRELNYSSLGRVANGTMGEVDSRVIALKKQSDALSACPSAWSVTPKLDLSYNNTTRHYK